MLAAGCPGLCWPLCPPMKHRCCPFVDDSAGSASKQQLRVRKTAGRQQHCSHSMHRSSSRHKRSGLQRTASI